jgi:ATP-dependent RNA helicase RhlE
LTQFTDFGLADPILKALASSGYETPTPIQTQAIPALMQGKDLLGIAQTGTGKTAAFALPILHRLAGENRRANRRTARALILSPTRELASQIAQSFRTYGRHLDLSVAVVFGGVRPGPQIKQLNAGVDILVATPGRLLDHMGTGQIRLDETTLFVLDEADQMLDLGFVQPIRRIVATMPRKRQSLFFSATMPNDIAKLANELLTDPVKVSVTPVATTVERVEQRALFVEHAAKRDVLCDLFADPAFNRVLVFTRTKHGADRVAGWLERAGVSCSAIHGNKSQGQRERALHGFRKGQVRALVATDIAARGIDVDGVSHVINFELPNMAESYVHRIGRTARAGAGGIALSLVGPGDEQFFLRDIERLIRQNIAGFHADGELMSEAERARHTPAAASPKASRGRPARSRNKGPQGHSAGAKASAHKRSGAPRPGAQKGGFSKPRRQKRSA